GAARLPRLGWTIDGDRIPRRPGSDNSLKRRCYAKGDSMAGTLSPKTVPSRPLPIVGPFVFAFVVFSVVAFLAEVVFFPSDDRSSIVLVTALGGAVAWSVTCGGRPQVAWLRAALTGALGSLLVPLCLLVFVLVKTMFSGGSDESFWQIIGAI